MPDEHDNEKADETPSTPLHAHAEGREQDVEGDIAGTEGEQDADSAENTGGSTSGGPGGAATGEEDPSQASGVDDATD